MSVPTRSPDRGWSHALRLPNGLTFFVPTGQSLSQSRFLRREIFEHASYQHPGFELHPDDTVLDIGFQGLKLSSIRLPFDEHLLRYLFFGALLVLGVWLNTHGRWNLRWKRRASHE